MLCRTYSNCLQIHTDASPEIEELFEINLDLHGILEVLKIQQRLTVVLLDLYETRARDV